MKISLTAVSIHLPFMPNTKRDYEHELLTAYETARPRILGALLKAVSAALKHRKDVKLARVPRMADFARWVTAAEPGLGWQKGDFMRYYTANRKEANEVALNSPLAAADPCVCKRAVRAVVGHGHRTAWSTEEARHGRHADRSILAAGHNALSGRLRRLRVDLRKGGVQVGFKRRTITVATKHLATSA